MKAIGIMGGTFDPIHHGHLMVAEAARVAFNLAQVTFVPAGQPPHKEGKVVAKAEDRYQMALLATMDNPGFAVSRHELDASGPSYTLHTVRYFRKTADKLYFIMGSDSLREIRTWRDWEELGDICEFLVAARPGEPLDIIPEKLRGKVHFLDVPQLAISAGEIRKRIRAKKSVKYLLPEAVEQYIMKEGLYRLVRAVKSGN